MIDTNAIQVNTNPDTTVHIENDYNQTREERAKEFRRQLSEIQKPVEEVIPEVQNEVTPSIVNDIVDSAGDSPDISDRQNNEAVENDLDSHPIPKKRLDLELQRRKEIEAELQKEREARIRIETELNIFNQTSQKMAAHKAEQDRLSMTPIDEEAHNYYTKKFADIEEQINQKVELLNQAQTQTRFEATITSQANEFTKKTPDFEDAYKFVLDAEVRNAKIMGFDGAQANELALQKLQPMAWQVYNRGGNVAEALYDMAKNYGYNGGSTPQRGNTINLNNINKNASRSQSIIDDIPAAVTSLNNTSAITKMENFHNIDRANGKGTDPDKFRKAIAALQQGNRV